MEDEEDYCPLHDDELLFPHNYDGKGYCKRCKRWYWFNEVKWIRKQVRG